MYYNKARQVAEAVGGQVKRTEDMDDGLIQYDVVMVCSNGTQLVLIKGGWLLDDMGLSVDRFYNS